VVWFSDVDNGGGFGVDFPTIMCHALAREPSFHFTKACVYCQLDSDDEQFHELRFVPQQQQQLDAIYKAFSECAALNPDEELEGEGDFIYNEDEVQQGMDRLAHMERVFQMPTPEELDRMLAPTGQQQNGNGSHRSNGIVAGQFEDVDEEEEEEDDEMES
jgi:nucleotide-sensitive chloride channel 1A